MESRFFPRSTFVPVRARKPVAPDDLAFRAAEETRALHDPALEPRDEAVFLLTAAAEIEHALMAQYLFAAYSVRVTGPQATELQRVQNLLVQIAREEMGHLVTVQNLLHLVGGPLNLGRDRAPYAGEVYPFRFTLEPVTLGSLAKYVTAESPAELPASMPDGDKELVEEIRQAAAVANGGTEVRHVGRVFERLLVLFGDPDEGLADADLRTDTEPLQATPGDWGYAPLNQVDGEPLIVGTFPGDDVAALRAAARAAVAQIADQGEGFDLPPAAPAAGESHFERFLDLYKRVAALLDQGVTVTWPVATNPNTVPEPDAARPADPLGSAVATAAAGGRITEPRARAWAQLFASGTGCCSPSSPTSCCSTRTSTRARPGPGRATGPPAACCCSARSTRCGTCARSRASSSRCPRTRAAPCTPARRSSCRTRWPCPPASAPAGGCTWTSRGPRPGSSPRTSTPPRTRSSPTSWRATGRSRRWRRRSPRGPRSPPPACRPGSPRP
ncbi:hypothetical protein BJF78_23475 [Pseudonocardia sp. CNS-139]|nr:hypothetical protein BJF78_23475 [Pseudonocardia sp. CNS-139]